MTGKRNTTLESFGRDVNCCVVGASGGIGRALTLQLAESESVDKVFAFSRAGTGGENEKIVGSRLDLEDEASIAAAAETIKGDAGQLNLVIVASGILHDGGGMQPEKTWRSLEPAAMEKAFRINSIGPALVAKHFLPLLARDRKSVFAAISARVGSIGDNELGGWYAYRASKAALNMLIKTYAIEVARRNSLACCVGLHPGTVDTSLSKPFQGGVPEGKLFPAARSAGHLLEVLDGLTPDDSGHCFAWDGQRIPP